MLITGVIHHQIHNQLHSPVMAPLQHLPECLHATKLGVNIHIIGNIIAAVRSRRGVNGGKPDAVTAQTFDIIQPLQNTPKISHTVPVPILKAPGPDLIKYHILVPAFPFHDATSCIDIYNIPHFSPCVTRLIVIN